MSEELKAVFDQLLNQVQAASGVETTSQKYTAEDIKAAIHKVKAATPLKYPEDYTFVAYSDEALKAIKEMYPNVKTVKAPSMPDDMKDYVWLIPTGIGTIVPVMF